MRSEPATLMVGPSPKLAVDMAGEGPGLLFLHGIGGNRTNWSAQLRAFAGTHRAIAFDFRGYGGSDEIVGDLAFADFVDDATRVLDHAGLEQAHLVGLSMGGLVAQALYARSPRRVLSLTLAACRPGSAPVLPGDRGSAFVEERLKPLQFGGPEALARSLTPSLLGPHASDEARRRIEDSLLDLRPAMYVKTLRARVGIEPFLDLGSIDVPVLVIGGGGDRLAPPEQMRDLAASVPGSRLHILEGAGHLVNVEEPAAFNAILGEFLRDGAGRLPG